MRISRAIHLFMTGGTIDSSYVGEVDTVMPNRRSVIPEYFKNLRLKRRLKFSPVCLKDSRDLTVSDRKQLMTRIGASTYRKMLVTHGTYTMAATAKYLEAHIKDENLVVVLTGSLMPLKGLAPSDASFNLGYAVAQLDILRPGVYICFNGETYRSARFDEFEKLVGTELKSQFTS
jgi:L-asparaginase